MSRFARCPSRSIVCCLQPALVWLAVLMLNAGAARAATFSIANGDVAGLKSALATANANNAGDTINLASGGTYTLTAVDNATNGPNGLPVIVDDLAGQDLTINGNGATIGRSAAAGTPAFRILQTGPAASVALNGVTVTGGYASDPSYIGGGLLNDHGSVALNSSTFSGNYADEHGGAIYSDGSSGSASLTLSTCTVTTNLAYRGGGIYNSGSGGSATVTVINSAINSNIGSVTGGGLYNDHGTLTISGGTVNLNTAPDEEGIGGGIYNDGYGGSATLAVSDCTLQGNSAGESGGGIENDGFGGSAPLTLTNCNFLQNEVGGYESYYGLGAGLFSVSGGATATISDCTFSGNTASGSARSGGGGILTYSPMTVSDSTFSGNYIGSSPGGAGGDSFGGGILNYSAMTISGSVISGNRIESLENNGDGDCDGGGIANYGAMTVSGSIISGNSTRSTDADGGGFFNSASLTVSNCSVNGNYADKNGGGFFNPSGTLTVSNCTLGGNYAGNGGGFFNSASLTVSNCALSANGSDTNGGAFYNVNGTLLLQNSTLRDSIAYTGGDICTLAASGNTSVTVRNCTLSRGWATSEEGGSIYNGASNGSASLTLHNSIFQHGDSGGNLFNSLGTIASQGHNLSDDDGGGFLSGPGDLINTNPLLDPLGLQANGGPTQTIALLPGSPAIDGGDDAVLGAPTNLTTDQRGLARKVGAHVDSGAYELETPIGSTNLVVTTTADHNDGACSLLDCTLLEALNAANANPDANVVNFKAGLGGTITNTLSPNGLAITKPVTINGPGARVLTVSGNNLTRGFIVSPSVTATISGLTIAAGRATYGAGIASGSGILTVNNCTLTGNTAFDDGSGGSNGGGISSGNTLILNNCTLSHNTAAGEGGGLKIYGTATLTNCTFCDNRAPIGGAVTTFNFYQALNTAFINCTISGNVATDPAGRGGGIYRGSSMTLDNTLVAGNTAASDPDVFGTIKSGDYNLIQNPGGGSFASGGTHNITGQSPNLGPLANNGGPTDTMALLTGSPAIDKGKSFGLTIDQRGQARPFDQPGIVPASGGDNSDIGAYERQAVALSINDVTVTEANGGSVQAQFTLSLSAPSAMTVTVSVQTANGGSPVATPGADYTALPATTVTFAPGQISKTVNVTVLGDIQDEPDEKFTVSLAGAVNATIADNAGVGTILDNDPAPTINASAPSVTEGHSGTRTLSFTLSLSAPSGRAISVEYKTRNAATFPAAVGVDYVAVPLSTATFLVGQTTKTVSVTINGDVLDEDNEHIALELSHPVNATIGTLNDGVIVDDDATPSLSISDVTVTEGHSGTTLAQFAVTLSAPSGRTVSVVAQTTSGGSPVATAGVDYVALPPTTLTFTPGQTSKTVSVTIKGDTLVEGHEKFVVSLSGAVNATLADNAGAGTITNDDASE